MTRRAALVSGGSSGLGLAVAEALAQDGYGVTITARRHDKLEDARASLAESGLDVHAVAADIRSEEAIERVVAEHRARFGRMDVLFNNAGVGFGAPMDGYPTRHLDLQLEVNLRGAMLLARDSLPLLKEAGSEHGGALLVNTASIAGKSGQALVAVYSATKAAMIAFTQALHKEVGAEGVKCIALCPAFVNTPMTDFAKAEVPPEEMIQPQDVAETVRYLLRLSRYCIVGEIVMIRPGVGF